jgi:hypothetical protein
LCFVFSFISPFVLYFPCCFLFLISTSRHNTTNFLSLTQQQQQPYTFSPEQQQQQQPYTFTPEQQQQPYTFILEHQQQQQQHAVMLRQFTKENPLKTYFSFSVQCT